MQFTQIQVNEGASAVDQVAEMLMQGDKEEAHQIGAPDDVTNTPVDYGDDEETTSEEVEVEAAVSEDGDEVADIRRGPAGRKRRRP